MKTLTAVTTDRAGNLVLVTVDQDITRAGLESAFAAVRGAGEGSAPGFSASAAKKITFERLPALATCSASDLNATFARAAIAVKEARVAADNTLEFVSLLGR
jgi:hypothetical protein